MKKQKTETKKRTWGLRAAVLVILAALQIMLLTACSVNIPMVSDSSDTEGYTDAQTMLIIATERNRYRQVYTDQIWNVEVSDDKTPFQTYLLEQIRTIDKQRLREKMGSLDDTAMSRIDQALSVSFGLRGGPRHS